MRDVPCGGRLLPSARFRAIGLVIAFVLAACNGASPTANPASTGSSATPTSGNPSTFTVTSNDLASSRWPSADTCDGADDIPDLHWTAGPPATAAYALQLFDPDAPNGGFTHWMLANEPPSLREPTPRTGVSGKNDFGNEGYNGPCPPRGSTHRYVLTVYALDAMLALHPLYRHADFQQALQGHILAQASLTATYGR